MIDASHYEGWPGEFVKLGAESKRPIEGTKRIETKNPQVAAQWLRDGFNVGLIPGESIVILDVDPRNGGDNTIKALKTQHSFPVTVAAKTGGDGLHAFYRWPEEASKPAGSLGAGVDVKHGLNCHVVGAGSVHPDTGKVYGWLAGRSPADIEIAPAPEWLVLKLTEGRARTHEGFVTELSTAPDFGANNLLEPETPEGLARLRSALEVLDADMPYDRWRDAVWACCATGWPSGIEAARDWSQAGAKWDAAAFEQVVADYRHKPDGVGLGTLFHMAAKLPAPGIVAGSHGEAARAILAVEAIHGEALGDLGNARLLAARMRGRFVYVPEAGWLEYRLGMGWTRAAFDAVEAEAKAVADGLVMGARQALREGAGDGKRLMSHAVRSHDAIRIRAMIDLAKTEPGMATPLDEWDANPYLLGVRNGVLDLKGMRLLELSPELRVSKRANVSFVEEALCPLFEGFIAEILPDAEVRDFMQRWLGYLLTGGVEAQKFLFAYGSGNNGKSVLLELMAALLGDYARKIPTEMLMTSQRDPNAPAPEVVGLKGVRLAYCSETEEGQRLAAARVKELTGGDTLTGRLPYAAQAVTFQPTHKLVMVGNHKPDIRDTSAGMWRRVMLVSFGVTIPKERVNTHLLDWLLGEREGILNWLLRGLADYWARGLDVPDSVAGATNEYREEQDVLGEWVHECLEMKAGASESKTDIYRTYAAWCKDNGHGAMSASKLSRRLKERGISVTKDKRGYEGARLTDEWRNAQFMPRAA